MKDWNSRVTISLRALRPHLLVYLSYLAITVYLTWPLITVFGTHLAGHTFADSYEYARHIWWFKYALQTGAPLFFQPMLAYPDGLPSAWLWSIPLQSFPAWLLAFVMPLPAAFNLSLLLTVALNGWAAYVLALYLTQNRPAAWLAGLVFMAYPTFAGQMAAGHSGLLALWGVPLFMLALFKLRARASRRWLALGIVFFVSSLLGSTLVLIYMLFPIVAVFGLMLIVKREWAGLRRAAMTVLGGGLLSLIFILPGAMESASLPPEGGDILYSADLLAVITPSFQNSLFSGLEYPHRVLGVDPFEKMAYVGIAAGVLGMIALWRQSAARWWLLLGMMAWVLSLGPMLKIFDVPVRTDFGGYDTAITLPWLWAQGVPLLNISRTPARFNFTLALAVAMLVGYGWSVISSWLSVSSYQFPVKCDQSSAIGDRAKGKNLITQYSLLVIIAVFVLYEYPFFWYPDGSLPKLPLISGVVPASVEALAEQDDIRAVLDVPWQHPLTDKAAMYLQTGHHQPLIAGHVVRETPVDPAKLWILQSTLDPALLNAAGADVVILHKEFDDSDGATETFMRVQLGEAIYEDETIAMFQSPETTDEPVFTTIVTSLTEVTDRADSYLYAPESGWVRFAGRMNAAGRNVSLYVNDMRVHSWYVENSVDFDVPLYLSEAGYYTVSLAVEPACPTSFNPTLECRAVELVDGGFGEFQPSIFTAVQFDRQLMLFGAQTRVENDVLLADLAWGLGRILTENDVRFVHVQSEDGQVVAQEDIPLGIQPEGGWSETVAIALPGDLPPGEYKVYTGWYAYPDTVPFPILSDVPNAAGGRLLIGMFTLG